MQFSPYNYRITLLESVKNHPKQLQCDKSAHITPQHITRNDHLRSESNVAFASVNWRNQLATLPTRSIEQQPADTTTHSIGCVTPLFTFFALIVFVQHCFSLRNSTRRGSVSERGSSNVLAASGDAITERVIENPTEFEAEERVYQELLVEQRRLRAEIARAQNVGPNDWAPTCTLIGQQSFCDKSGTVRDDWLAKRKCKSVGPVLQDSDETLKIDTTIAAQRTDEVISSYSSSYVCVN